MAWLWWLLAPVVSTGLGGLLIAARARHDRRWSGRPQDAMAEHRRLTAALERSTRPVELPANMVLLPAPAEPAFGPEPTTSLS